MSGDEVFMLIASAIVALVSWGAWYIKPALVQGVRRRPPAWRLLRLTRCSPAALLWAVLRNAASFDVRDDPRYLTFYLVLGAAWVGVWIRWLAVTGISTRDDVVERSNGSAALAVTGALLGITLAMRRRQRRQWPRVVGGGVLRGAGDFRAVRRVDTARDPHRRVRHRHRRSRSVRWIPAWRISDRVRVDSRAECGRRLGLG